MEQTLLPALRKLGIGFVPYSPLDRGFLTGTAKRAEEQPTHDWRAKSDPRFQSSNFDNNMKLAEFVRQIAQGHDATPGQVAIAWLLHRGEDIVPIPGTKRPKYLEENLAAASLHLSSEDLQKIEDFINSHPVSGLRYTTSDLARVNG